MNSIVNTIASSVLSRDFKDCSVDELKQLAETSPFSGALQLLYAQKLKEANSPDFQNQWEKALLYFNNPLFVQHIVNVQLEPNKEITKSLIETENVIDEQLPEADEQSETTISIPGLKIEPIDPAKSALSFTPYHTIDYFASLGIKLGEETKAADKFGNQLKSFTSWLKEMRRLPEAKVVSKFSKFEQNKVEKMAEDSLTGENAITEAMAQVWVKQNNSQKAIDIYKKLSLQNPAKSAFFAAKIEFLKKKL